MIKLGSIVTESATGLTGMATHLQIELNHTRYVAFQPRGLNPETGKPLKSMWVVPERLSGGEVVADPQLPIQVLGTEVEDLASGFKGTAVSLMLHINGCVHVSVQPSGIIAKTGAPVEAYDFDIRRLAGHAIPTMTEQQKEVDQQERPSPMETERYSPAADHNED